MNNKPSIFNDVIGPVMRGPSSSHTAASWRIARTCLDILNEPLKIAIVQFDKNSIWAHNYREQGTVMGINGGLLGIEITDSLMKNTEGVAEEMEISITYEINSFSTKHANSVRLFLEGTSGKTICLLAASLGGGSFEIQKIDDFDINIRGNYFELLAYCKTNNDFLSDLKKNLPKNTLLNESSGKNVNLINLKSANVITDGIISNFNNDSIFSEIIIIKPVLPIVAGNEDRNPFYYYWISNKIGKNENLNLGELGIIYEKCLSGLSGFILYDKMTDIVKIIENSIKMGLRGNNI